MTYMAGGLRGYWSVVIALVVLPVFGREGIWDIEFFGYKGIDIEAVRKAIPVHEGDGYAGEETKKRVRQAVNGTLGRDPTDVQGICCNENGDRVLFIGFRVHPTRASRTTPNRRERCGSPVRSRRSTAACARR